MDAGVRSVNSTPTVSEFASAVGAPLVWDNVAKALYALDSTESVVQIGGATPTLPSLLDGRIWVGNGSNVATAVTPSGDVTITNAGVTAIGANKVVTAKVLDANITYAKIQNVTDARLLGRSSGSAGAPIEITVGSGLSLAAGALTATGGGGDPTVTEIVASTAFPAANLVVITNIPATYRQLVLIVTGASSDTATRSLNLLASVDNGSSFAVTGYMWYGENTTPTAAGAATVFKGCPINQTAAQTDTFVSYITGYQGTTAAMCDTIGLQAGLYYKSKSVYTGSASAINALSLIWNGSGNFDAGTYKLLGIT